jgi:hypothetical protein
MNRIPQLYTVPFLANEPLLTPVVLYRNSSDEMPFGQFWSVMNVDFGALSVELPSTV